MSTSPMIDAQRLSLMLNELRLPTIKHIWGDFAERADKEGCKATHYLIDTDGQVGKAFGAKVTPHMFIVNKEGVIDYDGAIDSKATTKAEDIGSAEPLFTNALDAVLEGSEVTGAKNQPYGCGVKY